MKNDTYIVSAKAADFDVLIDWEKEDRTGKHYFCHLLICEDCTYQDEYPHGDVRIYTLFEHLELEDWFISAQPYDITILIDRLLLNGESYVRNVGGNLTIDPT